MPDLRSELSKIKEKQMSKDLNSTISEWAATDTQEPDTKEGKLFFAVTNNVSRETFNTIRDNPGKSFSEILDSMVKRGFKKSSVGSLIAQLVKAGQAVKDVNGRFYATQNAYTPIKSTVSLKKKAEKRGYTKREVKAGLTALQTHTEVVKPALKPENFDPDALLSTLSFTQAIQLYKKLKQMLGEV